MSEASTELSEKAFISTYLTQADAHQASHIVAVQVIVPDSQHLLLNKICHAISHAVCDVSYDLHDSAFCLSLSAGGRALHTAMCITRDTALCLKAESIVLTQENMKASPSFEPVVL